MRNESECLWDILSHITWYHISLITVAVLIRYCKCLKQNIIYIYKYIYIYIYNAKRVSERETSLFLFLFPYRKVKQTNLDDIWYDHTAPDAHIFLSFYTQKDCWLKKMAWVFRSDPSKQVKITERMIWYQPNYIYMMWSLYI